MRIKTYLKRKLGLKLTTREILQDIADATRLMPVNHFDINKWSCESAACAIGNAVSKGLVPGLVLQEVRKTCNGPVLGPVHLGTGNTDFAAVKDALGIPDEAIERLFSQDGYEDVEGRQPDGDPQPTPTEVADAIEAYIANDLRDH